MNAYAKELARREHEFLSAHRQRKARSMLPAPIAERMKNYHPTLLDIDEHVARYPGLDLKTMEALRDQLSAGCHLIARMSELTQDNDTAALLIDALGCIADQVSDLDTVIMPAIAAELQEARQ